MILFEEITKKKILPSNGYRNFLTIKEINLINIYIFLYIIFSLNILPKDIILGLITLVFMFSTLKTSLLMFLFFALWENVTVFSFGLSLNLTFQIVFCIKILLNSLIGSKSIFYRYSDLTFLIGVLFYGFLNFLIGTGTFSGIGMGFNVFIAIYAFSIYEKKEETDIFWKSVFYVIMISTLISVFYGYYNETSNDRWIKGLGYVKQIYGTIGTARIGMYLCTSLIYPVFYMENKFLKVMLSIILSIGAIITFSITTLICLIIFWIVVLLFKQKKNLYYKLGIISIVIIGIMIIIMLWSVVSEINIIKPIALRVGIIIDAFKSGDMRLATSSRSYLSEIYINDFREYGVIGKIFGSFYVNRFEIITGYSNNVRNYAHNSFIDIILYAGLFGILSFITKIVKNLWNFRRKKEFLPVLLLKIIFVITGMSVSMLTSTYWFIWIIL